MVVKKTKNRNGKFKKFALILVLMFVMVWILPYMLIQSSKGDKVEQAEEIDVMIVLGSGLWGDKVSPQLSLRLDAAESLLKKNKSMLVIVSGGQGPDELVSEAVAMKRYLVSSGIDERRILLEDKSTSTFENLLFSKKILDHEGIDYTKCVIVSTDFHIYRSKMLAKRLGIGAVGHAAPNIDSISKKNNFREVLALWKDFLLSHSQ